MRFRKIALLGMTGLLINVPISQASIKAGDACSKLGSIKTVKSVSYKCSSVKGKKIYQAVPVKKKVSPQAIAVPSPAPITQQSPAPESAKFGDLSGALSLAAFTNLINYADAQPTLKSGDVILELSPNASKSLADATLKDMQKGFQFWQLFTPPTTKIHMVFADRADLDWFKVTMERIQPGNSDWLPRIYSLAASVPKNAYAGANGRDAAGNALFFYLPGTSTSPTSSGWLGVGPHEWTHFAQNVMTGDIRKAPCWFKEGQATYFGNAISNNVLKDWPKVWKSQILSMKYDYPEFYDLNVDALRKWFINHELNMPNDVCGPDGAFMIGGIATEYLVGTIGVDGVNNFQLKLKDDQDWKSALSQVTGKSYEILMDEIIKFVLLQRSWSLS